MNKAQIVQIFDSAIQEANAAKQKSESAYAFIEMTARASALQESRDFILNNLDEPKAEEPKAEAERVRKESK